MDLLKLLQDLVAQLSALQAQLADVPAALEAAKKASFDEGVASVVLPPVSDKLYSQAELDAKIQEALLPVQEQLLALQAELEQVKASVDQKVADAVAAFKADLLVKIKQEELVIEDLLK